MKSSVVFLLLIAFWKQSEALDEPIDLGRLFDEKSVHWPGLAGFVITKRIRESNGRLKWLALNDFASGEHVATHLDAPFAFNKNGWKIGDIPLDNLIGPGICIDKFVKGVEPNANAILTATDVLNWEAKHGKIKKGWIILVKFGWGKYYGTRKYFYNDNVDDTMSFPFISIEAVNIFIERQVSGIGADIPSIDKGDTKTFDGHQALAKNNMFIMEHLDLSAHLPEKGFNIIALPMKIKEGTAAPLRVLAVPKFKDH